MDARSSPPGPTDGTLGKEIQASLGMQLRRHYQKIVEEGVPDRFAALLERFDEKVQGAAPAEARDAAKRTDEGKDPAS